MIDVETAHYIKGMHNLMSAHFDTQNYEKFEETLKQFEAFAESPTVLQNENNRIQVFIYLNIARLNQHFMNGTAALKFLYEHEQGPALNGPALVLLDLNLPDMSGTDILVKLKGENSPLKRTPVVVLTTTDDSHEIKRCYELGCNVYITKPVNYESFANAIRQLGLFFSVIQVPPAAK